MSVNDGQNVDAGVTNAAYMDKNQDTFTVGKVDLQNPDAANSGGNITNQQREHNGSASFSGRTVDGAKDELPAWIDSSLGTPTDNLKDRADTLTTEASANKTNISQNTLDIAANVSDIADTKTALGIADGDTDMGVYPGAIISDNIVQTGINTELEAAIEAIPSGLVFKGNWDADTNSPTLADGGVGGTEGDYYIVNVAGSTSIDGITDWGLGDWIVNVDTKWDKIDNSETVTSVNGQSGTVVLDTDDVAEGVVNEYHTAARVNALIALASIDDLSDVDTTTSAPSIDDALTWNGTDWVPGVGGGGGGSGGINYLSGDSTNFEGGTVGDWITYADAAGPEPVDGIGGVPSVITFSADNFNLLRGDWLGNFAKISNAQGEGISVPFLIDNADHNKTLYISFDYFTNGGYVQDDVKVFVYDIDASELTPVRSSGSSTRFTGSFNTNGTSNNYRLIFHVASTSALSWGFAFDNIIVGPDKLIQTLPLENYNQLVAAPTIVTPGVEVSNVANLRLSGSRVGGAYTFAVNFDFDIVTGNNADLVEINIKNDFPFLAGKTITNIEGSFSTSVNGSTVGRFYVFGSFLLIAGNHMRAEFFGDFANLTNRRARGTVTIYVEDEANESAILSTKEILNSTEQVEANRSATTQAIPAATVTKILFNNKTIDDLGLFDTSASEITIKKAGKKFFSGNIALLVPGVQASFALLLFKNGVAYRSKHGSLSTAGTGGGSYSFEVNAQIDDVYDLRIDCSQATGILSSGTVFGGSTFNMHGEPDITAFAAPQGLLKTQTKFMTGDATSALHVRWDDVKFENLVIGQWYEINSQFRIAVNTGAANTQGGVKARHDGATIAVGELLNRQTSSTVGDVASVHPNIKFKATATELTFEGLSTTASSPTLGNGTTAQSWVQLSEIHPQQSTNEW